jgi:hypothetical protein
MSNHQDVLVKHVYGRVFDAFWGSGWNAWTRFLIKNGKAQYIKGKSINKEDAAQLEAAVQANEAQPGE